VKEKHPHGGGERGKKEIRVASTNGALRKNCLVERKETYSRISGGSTIKILGKRRCFDVTKGIYGDWHDKRPGKCGRKEERKVSKKGHAKRTNGGSHLLKKRKVKAQTETEKGRNI